MRMLIVGHGRMGQLIEALAPEYGVEVAGIVHGASGARQIAEGDFGPVDVAVDFTLPDAVPETFPQLAARRISVVIGTTGWQAHEAALRTVAEEAGIGVMAAANFSLGMNLFQLVVEEAARLFAPQADFGAWIHELPATSERILAALTGGPMPPPPGVSLEAPAPRTPPIEHRPPGGDEIPLRAPTDPPQDFRP